jgi:hypothetical protein
MARTRTFQKVRVHDFRVVDQVLYESDPDADNVVYVGTAGSVAYPFAVARRVSGPSGWYVDTCRIMAAGRFQVAEWDHTFELEGESVDEWIVDTKRHIVVPGQGAYTLEYYVFGEKVVDIDFTVTGGEPPYAGIVPGPVDAALSKGTIAWIGVTDAKGRETTKPVWYGYERGLVYVLVGPDEQEVPGMESATTVQLLVRSKEKQSLVGDMECSVRKLPKGAEWDTIARDVLIGRRLNLTDGEKALERWRRTCETYVLTPVPPEPSEA